MSKKRNVYSRWKTTLDERGRPRRESIYRNDILRCYDRRIISTARTSARTQVEVSGVPVGKTVIKKLPRRMDVAQQPGGSFSFLQSTNRCDRRHLSIETRYFQALSLLVARHADRTERGALIILNER